MRPNALGLSICSHLIVDRASGRYSLIGLFDALTCREEPFTPPPFFVYAALTDGLGRCELELRLLDLGTDELVHSESVTAEITNSLHVAHAQFYFEDFEFPAAGHYIYELFGDGELICQRRLHIYFPEGSP